VPGVDGHVVDPGRGPVAGVEDQVTGAHLAHRHVRGGCVLVTGGARQRDAGVLEGLHRQTGAVVAVRALSTPDVGLAELGHRPVERSLAGARRGGGPAAGGAAARGTTARGSTTGRAPAGGTGAARPGRAPAGGTGAARPGRAPAGGAGAAGGGTGPAPVGPVVVPAGPTGAVRGGLGLLGV